MRFTILCLAFLLLQEGSAISENLTPKPEHITFLGLELGAEQVLRSVFAVQVQGDTTNISKDDDWLPLGSGFLTLDSHGRVVGFTCYHVVDAAKRKSKRIYIGMDTEIGYQRLLCQIEYEEQSTDIAVLRPRGDSREIGKIANLAFTRNQFAEDEDLSAGKGVIIPGYPLGIGVEYDKNHPVLRFGIIAQSTGKSSFLIDGAASHGSSGSPVVLLNGLLCAGMITSHVPDYITLFDERGKPAARLPYNSGLGRAITGQALKRILVDHIQ